MDHLWAAFLLDAVISGAPRWTHDRCYSVRDVAKWCLVGKDQPMEIILATLFHLSILSLSVSKPESSIPIQTRRFLSIEMVIGSYDYINAA